MADGVEGSAVAFSSFLVEHPPCLTARKIFADEYLASCHNGFRRLTNWALSPPPHARIGRRRVHQCTMWIATAENEPFRRHSKRLLRHSGTIYFGFALASSSSFEKTWHHNPKGKSCNQSFCSRCMRAFPAASRIGLRRTFESHRQHRTSHQQSATPATYRKSGTGGRCQTRSCLPL